MKLSNKNSKKINIKKPFNSSLLTAFAVVFAVIGLVSLLSTFAAPTPTFTARFETPSDFYDRFVYHTGNYRTSDGKLRPEDTVGRESGQILDWNGDHNMNCDGPTTLRNVNVENHNEFFWWCAPGGDTAKGHIMTSINTNSYVIASFSPNQTFNNLTQFCWDINKTDLGGGKWTNAIVVPESVYLSNPNIDQVGISEGEGPYRLDYVTPGFNDDNGPGDFNLQRFDIWGFRTFRNQLSMFRGDNIFWQSYNGEFNLDKAARYKNCIKENSDGTVTLTITNPGGAVSSYVANSQIPDGRVRVIFQDDNYNPPKREGYNINNNTWHWDNIEIYDESNSTTPPPPPANIPPTSTISTSVSTIQEPASYTITSTASDSDGSVTKIDILQDSTIIKTCTSVTTCSHTVSNITQGSYTYTSRATDNASAVTTSTAKIVTVTAPPTPSDTTPPTVSLTAPANNATVSGSVTVSANATDNVGVARVSYFLDGSSTAFSNDTSAPYSSTWVSTTVANGNHTIRATAIDAAGNVASSQTITVNVQNTVADTTKPTTSITSPANNATVAGYTTINATATDNIGVTKLELLIDGTLAATDTTNPYSYILDTTILSEGNHTLTTRAYDAANNQQLSSPIAINVDNIPPEPLLCTDTTATNVGQPLPCTYVNPPATAPEVPGDSNNDGLVNRTDLRLVSYYYGQTVPVYTNGDVNGDGKVDRNDKRIVLYYYKK